MLCYWDEISQRQGFCGGFQARLQLDIWILLSRISGQLPCFAFEPWGGLLS